MPTRRTAEAAPRIVGAPVPLFAPNDGDVHVFIIGEAPGPRGADKSGIPFWGDAAGRHLYTALASMGAVTLPAEVPQLSWDGADFHARGLRPMPHGVALGNAFDRCPTDDGMRFRAPTRGELEGAPNVSRLAADITALRRRGLRGVVTLGRVAARTLGAVARTGALEGITEHALVHPSAQGLLSMAPDRGRGARMVELQAQWMARCCQAVRDAGYPGEIP